MRVRLAIHHRLQGCIVFFVFFIYNAVAQTASTAGGGALEQPPPAMTAQHVIELLVSRNAGRAEALKGYRASRTYKLDYKGFPGSKSAEMRVEVSFAQGTPKQFRIVSESGSSLLINRVLKKLIEGEREASEQSLQRTAVSPENYAFTLDRTELVAGRLCYVMNVEPRRRDKFLYKGKIWIDAQDFAVARIEAQPAKNPSFWIKKTDITHQYRKVGDFWLPAGNHSESSTRLGGHAVLTIEYTDYEITPATYPAKPK